MNFDCQVTYGGYDETLDLISVIRHAKGRNGQIRPINLMIPFKSPGIQRYFFQAVGEGRVNIGDEISLSLERCHAERGIYIAIVAWRASECQRPQQSGLLCPSWGELR